MTDSIALRALIVFWTRFVRSSTIAWHQQGPDPEFAQQPSAALDVDETGPGGSDDSSHGWLPPSATRIQAFAAVSSPRDRSQAAGHCRPWMLICSLTWPIASLPAIPTKLRATGPSPRLMSRRPRG